MNINKILLLMAMGTLAISACKDKTIDPGNAPVNETELITTVQLVLTDSADGSKSVFTFRDKDGEGGNPPELIDTIKVKSQWHYHSELIFLDESKTPVDTVSKQIRAEGTDHLVHYFHNNVNIHIYDFDLDGKGLPLGLKAYWDLLSPDQTTLRILLKHQPGIKTGWDITIGETDADVTFPVQIK